MDTCDAELETDTTYFDSSYDEESEASPNETKKVIILGWRPNRNCDLCTTNDAEDDNAEKRRGDGR